MDQTPQRDPRIDLQSFTRGGANTAISYLYRDAHNYKQDETLILPGALTLDQAIAIVDGTDDEDGFIPSAVGMDDLQTRSIDSWNRAVDHPFHEIALIALTTASPTTSLEADDLAYRFAAADWEAEAERVEREHQISPGEEITTCLS